MRTYLAALALAAATQAFGAEPDAAVAAADEFRQIAAAHRNLRAYDLQITASIDTAGSSVPLHATVKCDARARCLRKFRTSTVLLTPEMSLMIEDNERTITVTRYKIEAPLAMDSVAALQVWLDAGGRITGGEITEGGRHWILQSAMAGLQAGHMYVDVDSRLLRRLVYSTHTQTGSRATVDIHYTWRDPAQLSLTDFETHRIVEERHGTLVPAPDYAHYRLINADRK